MKKNRLFLLFISTIISAACFSQIQDLASMAEGKIVYHSTIFDSDDQLSGYLYIYERDTEDDQSKTMEYIFLDKNLNKVSNKEFTNKIYKNVKSSYYDCTLMGDYIILNRYYYYITTFRNDVKPLLTTFQIISLKENTVSTEFKYENGQFIDFVADFENMKTEYKGNDSKSIIHAFNRPNLKGFNITEENTKNGYLEKEFKFFNEKKENIWSYQFNPNGTSSEYNTFGFLHTSKNTIYIGVAKWQKKFLTSTTLEEYKIVALDLLTGKTDYEYTLEKQNDDIVHFIKLKELDDNRLVITGLFNSKMQNGSLFNKYSGVYKIVLDNKGKEVDKKYKGWDEIANGIEIKPDGEVSSGYNLLPVRYLIFNEGSISILTQKARPQYYGYKYTDFVLFNLDKNFDLKETQTIVRQKSDYDNGFLFSQYIKNDSGAVFFFHQQEKNPETKEKCYYLYINTIIDGKYGFEKIPLTAKKKFFIAPYPAKEGYVMLREYNENEKYNQIRLEKLNY